MRHALGDYDDHDAGYGLAGEARDYAEEQPSRDRRLPMVLLAVCLMALFAGGLYFAYLQGTRHSDSAVRGDGVPLLKADEHPSKVKPDQPGGMQIPDQNVSLYNEKAGGPPVEKLLPPPEQPMPRPAPPPPAKETAEPPAPAIAVPATANPAAPVAGEPQPSPDAKNAKAAAPPGAKPPAATAKSGTIQVRLGSLRTPEEARQEWAKLKRENADLLGSLSAVAVRTDLGDKGVYYRIQAGAFADAGAAEHLCAELKRRSLGCILAR